MMTSASSERPPLTPEQLDVIRLAGRDWTDQRIADELGVSLSTVQRRLRAAADALGTSSRVGTVLRAARLGLISEPE